MLALNHSKNVRIAYVALFFIVVEILIGMFVVLTNLQSLVVAIHLSNGVVVFALTILFWFHIGKWLKVILHSSN
jgi:heme A synthase